MKILSIISYVLLWLAFGFWLGNVFIIKNEIIFYLSSASILCFAFATLHFHRIAEIENIKNKIRFEKDWDRMCEEDEELDD